MMWFILYLWMCIASPIFRAVTSMISTTQLHDFIFGYSTGHVGTTSLGSGNQYRSDSSWTFIDFEGQLARDAGRINTSTWKKYSFIDEYSFVKTKYIPWILQNTLRMSGSQSSSINLQLQQQNDSKPKIFMDLGHHNLYFADALVEYLLNETSYRFILVRIERPRYETARSLSEDKWIKRRGCGMLFRLCPFDRTDDVVIQVNRSTWTNASDFQRALWLIDEVEARWRRLLKRFPEVDRLYLRWSQLDSFSFYEASASIARLLNISSSSIRTIHKMKHISNASASHTSNPLLLGMKYASEDREYQHNFNVSESIRGRSTIFY